MKKTLFQIGPPVLIVLIALAFRLPELDLRPMHADESVQAARFKDLLELGDYRYDPHEFHGPTLQYATLLSVVGKSDRSYGAMSENTYRLVPVVFGSAVVLLALWSGRWLGWPAAISAALFFAVSPAMVFYSRYYIHEMLLVFFSMAALFSATMYSRGRKTRWCLLAGLSVALMQATKETAAIVYLAVLLTAIPYLLTCRRNDAIHPSTFSRLGRRHLLAGVAVAALVAALLFSSFGSNPRGVLDAALTYGSWIDRAGETSVHSHPWHFYLHRLLWWRVADGPIGSEGLVVGLAIVGWLSSWGRIQKEPSVGDRAFVRWIGWYALMVTGIYSAIPYKTPWCLLQFYWCYLLLAGVGAAYLVDRVPWRMAKWTTVALLAVATIQLGWQSYGSSYTYPAEAQNPYVYAHTSPDLLRLVRQLEQLAEASAEGRRTDAQVVWPGALYWPLPWYLRRWERIQWWSSPPERLDAPIVIASPVFDRELTDRLGDDYVMIDFYRLRPGVFAQMWVRFSLWERHLRILGRI